MKDFLVSLDGLTKFRSEVWFRLLLVTPAPARGLSGLFRRSLVLASVGYSAAGGALPGLFFSFTLFDTRTDFEVLVLPSVEGASFDLENSFPLCTAEGCESVFRKLGFHREQSSGAEL